MVAQGRREMITSASFMAIPNLAWQHRLDLRYQRGDTLLLLQNTVGELLRRQVLDILRLAILGRAALRFQVRVGLDQEPAGRRPGRARSHPGAGQAQRP
jgi:hypothetical protein